MSPIPDFILIASNNAHKLQEFREIFAQFGARHIALLTPEAIGVALEPDETADPKKSS
jgi:inosine/xanthosine triphosphate pyrophosphatase family protein